jgi:hypothetical protein
MNLEVIVDTIRSYHNLFLYLIMDNTFSEVEWERFCNLSASETETITDSIASASYLEVSNTEAVTWNPSYNPEVDMGPF